MATSQQHIQQWTHNRSFLGTIETRYPDWVVTVVFYVALHAVDALLAHDRVAGITRHDARNRALINTNRYKQVWKHYRSLYDLARTVRYLAEPADWVPADQLDTGIIRGHLYPIEKSVQSLMGVDLRLPPISMPKTPAPVPSPRPPSP